MEQSLLLSKDEIKLLNQANTININVGVLGHIDSGKTSLCRVLSKVTSTASLDKHPQSQERGITLDLGFSAFFTRQGNNRFLQFTLVDCPGHASLIKTIIGGAQIIDAMMLVIDITKGIQTQTSECLVIGEILQPLMIVVLNKIDLLNEEQLPKKIDQFKKVFNKTKFGENVLMVPVSATKEQGIEQLVRILAENVKLNRTDMNQKKNLLFMIDHCFALKGQGTVTTGTVLQGSLQAGDEVYFPEQNFSKKVKSIQMFKRPIEFAGPGDRIATLFAGLDPEGIERTIVCHPGVVYQMENIVLELRKVIYYKSPIKSGLKFHITSGHQTVMGQIRLFIRPKNLPYIKQNQQQEQQQQFQAIQQNENESVDGEYIEDFDSCDKNKYTIYCLIQLEKPILASKNSLIIASKLDTDLEANICRIAFYGSILQTYQNKVIQCQILFLILRIFFKKNHQGYSERKLEWEKWKRQLIIIQFW